MPSKYALRDPRNETLISQITQYVRQTLSEKVKGIKS